MNKESYNNEELLKKLKATIEKLKLQNKQGSKINSQADIQISKNNSIMKMNLNIKQLANKMCNTEINNLEEKNKKRNKLEIKTEDFPGPGDYDITEYIKVPICFSNVTNFGSNASRGLLYPNKDIEIKGKKEEMDIDKEIKDENEKKEIDDNEEIKEKLIEKTKKIYMKQKGRKDEH